MPLNPNDNAFFAIAITAAISVGSVLIFGYLGATLNEAWSIR